MSAKEVIQSIDHNHILWIHHIDKVYHALFFFGPRNAQFTQAFFTMIQPIDSNVASNEAVVPRSLSSITVIQVLGIIYTLFVVQEILKISYRLYMSPIAKFPGPKIAAATWLYQFYYDVIKRGSVSSRYLIDNVQRSPKLTGLSSSVCKTSS